MLKAGHKRVTLQHDWGFAGLCVQKGATCVITSVDGDGSTDCMVGVIKPTRYYPTPARRLFIFKNFRGHVRPLWMGSKLGGILKDFRFLPDTEGGIIRAVESTTDGLFVVAEYRWQGFGMGFERFLAVKV